MTSRQEARAGLQFINEMKEFAGFSAGAQRYVRRSLDVAFGRSDALALWSRDAQESQGILVQQRAYAALPAMRCAAGAGSDGDDLAVFMGQLIDVTAFDLAQGRLDGFGPYRFLYERLLGAPARPWLPAGFCGAAALPIIHPARRRTLLHSISEAAATAPGWSELQPCFFPEWVEKVAA
jgi:hypothetical protein